MDRLPARGRGRHGQAGDAEVIVKAVFSSLTKLPRRVVVDEDQMRAALKAAKVKPTRNGMISQDEMEQVHDAAELLGLAELADGLGGLVSAKGGFVLQPWSCRPGVDTEVAA